VFLMFLTTLPRLPLGWMGRIGSNADFFPLERFAIFSVKAAVT